jgi:hypothetical protein
MGFLPGVNEQNNQNIVNMAGAGMGTSGKMIQHCPVESPAINPKGQHGKAR